jgi:hypothetical protein
VYESATADIHADMCHLARNAEEQNVTNLQVTRCDRPHILPQPRGRSWYALASASVSVVNQAAAIESAG